MAVQTQIQARRGTAATWASTNPTLAAGETGYETDTGKIKIGTGSTAWASLGYLLFGSGFSPLPYITNNYYGSPMNAARSTSTFSAGITSYSPFFVRENRTFNRIAMSTSSLFSGTASVRLGIYNQSNGVPSTVLLDAGLVAPAAASTVYEITISQALTPGWYWLAANTVTAATTNSLSSVTGSAFPNAADLGATSATANMSVSYLQTVSAASSFATAIGVLSNSAVPSITLRA